MRRLLLSSTVLVAWLSCSAGETPVDTPRPRITGIALVVIHVSEPKASLDFYSKGLGLGASSADCGDRDSPCFALSGSQFVAIGPGLLNSPSNLIGEVAFATSDVSELRKYLVSHGVQPGDVTTS